jgi:uncharacterized hydrophobic protein (TIGR00271 family)
VVHLRIVAPGECASRALQILRNSGSVCNVVHLPDATTSPKGDLILADVAREDATVILADLKELELHKVGSIVIDEIDAMLSDHAEAAERHAPGSPADAVVWEQVEARTSESTELSGAFLSFMVLAALLASVGIYLDSPILIVGAMVVGPEFGPIAGFCVALVERRRDLAVRSGTALAVGLPLAITAAWLATVVFRATGLTPHDFSQDDHGLAAIISSPDFFSLFVAVCAGAAGIISLSTAKSGAIIGVLISVTTIPAAANIGVAAAYGDTDAWIGSMAQLSINLAGILVAGTTTLWIQRMLYRRRRIKHLRDPVRRRAGLPVGHSLHAQDPDA